MFNTNSPTDVLAGLLAGVFLLLYGVRLVSDAVQRVASWRMQEMLTRLSAYPLATFGTGIVATTILQSSNATASLLVELVSTSLVPLSTAIAMLLGANVGTTLVVQLLAFHITDYGIPLIGLGTVIALFTHDRPTSRRSGRVLFAFGLIMLGLATIQAAGKPLAASPITAQILQSLAEAPPVLVLIGALLAVVLNSSAASIGLVLTLAENKALPTSAALALTLGANVGTTLLPLLASLNKGMLAGRRLALVHSGTKLLGAAIFLLLLDPLTALLPQIWPDPGVQVAMLHLCFNLILALPFLPFVGFLARLMERLLPEEKSGQSAAVTGPRVLDARALETPAVAQGLATRETLRMADIVTHMLELSIQAFAEQPDAIQKSIEAMDDQLDELNTAIKSYLTQLDEKTMSEEQAGQNITLLYIINDLEAIGDVITKRFMYLAHRRSRNLVSFSEEGWEDLLSYHQRIGEALQQVLAALATQNLMLATDFLARKEELQRIKRELHLSHFRRLRAGIPNTTTSSAIHLDLLDAMSAILTHTSNIAHALQGEEVQ
ncbi:MAG: Na/Pi cotransporter family protein [Chloroflexi bacterium]|nr:MAG: Na/Pi cotransporter family protein [Chloroflexota bacterium]